MGTPVHKWKKNILIDDYIKIPAEFFDHCQNFYETFEVPAGCCCMSSAVKKLNTVVNKMEITMYFPQIHLEYFK